MLDVKLLGQFNVTQNGRPVEVSSRPAQLLLAYLILNEGPHPRESVAGLLWPDSSADNARANLRHALWRLRSDIGDDVDGGSATIDCGTNEIAINRLADYVLDVKTLEGQHPESYNGWTTTELIAAAQAYRGELLPGFYEPWVVLERERLAAVFEQRMGALLNRLMRERRWDEVLYWAEHWIALGETPEPAYRALMRSHAARGDSGFVAATYRRCREALREELGISPSPVTQRLAEVLLRPGRAAPEEEEASPWISDWADSAEFERRRADLYRRAALRSDRLALGALLGLAAAIGVAVAARRR